MMTRAELAFSGRYYCIAWNHQDHFSITFLTKRLIKTTVDISQPRRWGNSPLNFPRGNSKLWWWRWESFHGLWSLRTFQKIIQLDSDGDGVLSFEEFKVLFDNNEKRKESKLAAQNKVSLQNWPSVMFLEMKEKYLIILQQRQLKMWTMNYLNRQQRVVREEMNTESLGRKINIFISN